MTIVLWKGDLKEALELSKFDQTNIEFGRINYFFYLRQYEKLITNTDLYEDQFIYSPKSLNLAFSYFLNANNSMSVKYADSAIAELSQKIKQFPEDDRYYAALGYAFAYKGEKNKAIECVQKAVNLKPIRLDAWQGYHKELDLMKIYIITGDYDLAMDKIEYLLKIPGDLSVPFLKVDPVFDKLRNLTRFQRILTTEYKTNYE